MSMLDDLRKEAASSYDETPQQQQQGQEQAIPPEEYYAPGSAEEAPRKKEFTIFGLNAPQRFILAVILFLMTCVLGAFCLILTEKIVLPF